MQCPLLGVKRTLGWRVLSFICVPSASRGHADERAFHLLLNALHRAGADAALARDLAHAFAGAQLRLDSLFDGGIDFRPTKLLALRNRPLEASMHALPPSTMPVGCGISSSIGLIRSNSIQDTVQAQHQHIPDQHNRHHSRDGEP